MSVLISTRSAIHAHKSAASTVASAKARLRLTNSAESFLTFSTPSGRSFPFDSIIGNHFPIVKTSSTAPMSPLMQIERSAIAFGQNAELRLRQA